MEVCRLCLSQEKLIDVLKDPYSSVIVNLIKLTAGIELKSTDTISKLLCQDCLTLNRLMYQYRLTAIDRESFLMKTPKDDHLTKQLKFPEAMFTSLLQDNKNLFYLLDKQLLGNSFTKLKLQLKSVDNEDTVMRKSCEDLKTDLPVIHASIKDIQNKYKNLLIPSSCLEFDFNPSVPIKRLKNSVTDLSEIVIADDEVCYNPYASKQKNSNSHLPGILKVNNSVNTLQTLPLAEKQNEIKKWLYESSKSSVSPTQNNVFVGANDLKKESKDFPCNNFEEDVTSGSNWSEDNSKEEKGRKKRAFSKTSLNRTSRIYKGEKTNLDSQNKQRHSEIVCEQEPALKRFKQDSSCSTTVNGAEVNALNCDSLQNSSSCSTSSDAAKLNLTKMKKSADLAMKNGNKNDATEINSPKSGPKMDSSSSSAVEVSKNPTTEKSEKVTSRVHHTRSKTNKEITTNEAKTDSHMEPGGAIDTNALAVDVSLDKDNDPKESCIEDHENLLSPTDKDLNLHICIFCNKVFDTKKKLTVHIKDHSVCTHCKTKFQNTSLLHKHWADECIALKPVCVVLERLEILEDMEEQKMPKKSSSFAIFDINSPTKNAVSGEKSKSNSLSNVDNCCTFQCTKFGLFCAQTNKTDSNDKNSKDKNDFATPSKPAKLNFERKLSAADDAETKFKITHVTSLNDSSAVSNSSSSISSKGTKISTQSPASKIANSRQVNVSTCTSGEHSPKPFNSKVVKREADSTKNNETSSTNIGSLKSVFHNARNKISSRLANSSSASSANSRTGPSCQFVNVSKPRELDEKHHIRSLFKKYKDIKEGKGKKAMTGFSQTFTPSLSLISRPNFTNHSAVFHLVTVLHERDVTLDKRFSPLLKISFSYEKPAESTNVSFDCMRTWKGAEPISLKCSKKNFVADKTLNTIKFRHDDKDADDVVIVDDCNKLDKNTHSTSEILKGELDRLLNDCTSNNDKHVII